MCKQVFFWIVLLAAPLVNLATMYTNLDCCVVHQVCFDVEFDCSLVEDARRSNRLETVKRESFYIEIRRFIPIARSVHNIAHRHLLILVLYIAPIYIYES